MALAVKLRATKQQFDDMIGIHPTDAEQSTKLKVCFRNQMMKNVF
jgi:pyruvate/2-oxoglutarate dehydrogenase complex dihydrolipoamide dehydrogenase (E3) component